MDDPLPTAATIRDVAHHPAGAVVDITLKAADILLEDFKYASNTAALTSKTARLASPPQGRNRRSHAALDAAAPP